MMEFLKSKKSTALLTCLIFGLSASLVSLYQSNEQLMETIKASEAELVQLEKESEQMTSRYDVIQAKLQNAQERFFEDVAGFKSSTLTDDEAIVLGYLGNIFTWTNGNQYDSQRQAIQKINADGTDDLLNTIMMENYRVEVPEDLKGTIKDNDIDVNGLKSSLIAYRLDRVTFDKTQSADVTYTARITYQVYIDEADLDGDYKTTTDMLFTLKLSGVGKNRQVVDVKYAFVQ